MILSGNIDLDKILRGGYDKEINMIYGPAASGKTTLAILTAINAAKYSKVLFLDSENGFRIERVKQIIKNNIKILKNIFIFNIKSFEEQNEIIKEALEIIDKFGLIIVDTISAYYRKELQTDVYKVNKLMDIQLRNLKKISEKIPVLITNQVYMDINKKEISIVGGDMVKGWSDCLIELKKDPRKLILRKPEYREMLFKIVDEGIVKI